MQKLRQLYAETQNNAKVNFDKVTLERCKKILAYANREYDSMIAQGDYTHIEEISFYQEKYRLLIEKFNSAINDKTKKSKLQADVQVITVENYGSPLSGVQTALPGPTNSGTAHFGGDTAPFSGTPQVPPQKTNFIKREGEIGIRSVDPKELMNSYFQTKKNQIQYSMVGFKSVLDGLPKPSQKYAIRSKVQQKNQNNQEISKLNEQISDLGKKLEESKMVSDFNHGLYQVQKNEYQGRIKELINQIQNLNRQNEKLKQQSVGYRPSPRENIQTHQIFDPRVIKYQENNIYKLKNKYYGQNSGKQTLLKNEPHTGSAGSRIIPYQRKPSEEEILFKAFNEPNKYQVQFEKSNLKFNKSQADNQEKNIIIRSKLSFFKSSMVLYRGDEFEVAIKSCDIHALQSRKITIFVNNKDKFERKLSIAYTVDSNYYQLKVTKKLTQVQGLRQGKQQIQVTLKNKNDLDSMIEAKLIMNNKAINFLIPTMFIEFSTNKFSGKRYQNYQKNVVTPIYQFSNIFSAMEIVPLEKDYEDKIEKGSVYARSKYHEGMINLRWKGRRQLQIQTIKPWVLFISYLMYKDY